MVEARRVLAEAVPFSVRLASLEREYTQKDKLPFLVYEATYCFEHNGAWRH